jgi:hypothetical protein
MAVNVLVLKKRAIAAGMPKPAAMKADRATLEEFLANTNDAPKKATAKKKTKAAPAKKKAAAKKVKAAPAPKAKKASTKKAAPKGSGDGRHMIGSLDFSDTDGWNPREGSPVALIFRALKKRRGDVDKTTDDLLPNAKDYVSTKKADGTKRTAAEIRNLLRYRVNRTKWEFATRTGQHEASDARVEYGTGEYAQQSKKAKRSAARKPTASKPTRKAGRKTAKKKTRKK